MVAAILVALFLYLRPKLWNTKLVRGDYGVAITYWLFDFLGTIVVVGSAYLYVSYKMDAMESMDSRSDLGTIFAVMGAFSAPATAAVVVFLHQITVIVSVWRATAKKGVSFWKRWFARYGLLFNAFIAALVFSFGTVGLGLGLVAYLIVWHFFLRRKGLTRARNKSAQLHSDIPALSPAVQPHSMVDGDVEIVLADLSLGEPLLEQYVQCLKATGYLSERIHVVPNIPVGRLKAAIDSRHFKKGLIEQKALLLVDDSQGLTGKEGLLVTDQMFDFKPASGKASSYGCKLGFDGFETKGASIFRMGEECISFRNIDAGSVAKIFLLLNSYFSDHMSWCEKMAHEGDREAQFNMSMYAKTKTEGLAWLRRAAEQGHAIAQGNLGVELAGSNLEDSYYWLSRAVEQGNEISIQRLSSTQYDVFR